MTAANTVIDQLHGLGVHVVADGDQLRASPSAAVTPEVRNLVAANRPALLAALQPLDLHDLPPAGLHADARTVMCTNCTHLIAKAGSRPDGWCRHYQTETWQRVPFECAGFSSSGAP